MSDLDSDADDRDRAPGDDEWEMIAAGHGASGADRRAIVSLLRTYYAAATAGEGAKGCSLIDPTLAAAISGGTGAGQANAGSCATALSRLFAQQHRYLVSENPSTMVVTAVHVKGDAGTAMLGFKAMPETEILVQRDGGRWKMNALFDRQLP